MNKLAKEKLYDIRNNPEGMKLLKVIVQWFDEACIDHPYDIGKELYHKQRFNCRECWWDFRKLTE